VEALAEVLHGSAKNVLRIDCGEFQMDHEVARLVGAPPGYLGHRETHPMLSQAKVNSVASTQSSVSIVLFDEIEKAAPSMTRLMLGVLDKATLRLGDNNSVNFEKSMIFLTSNLGASKMMKEFAPVMGFGGAAVTEVDRSSRLESIAMGSAKRAFPPEFLNRVDATVTYEPLSEETLFQILEQQLQMLQKHIRERLGDRAFVVHVPKRVKLFLLEQGLSKEYGAREIKRTVHKHLMQPLAAMVAAGMIYPGSIVGADVDEPEGRVVLMAA
jgi:ATP-dependent Clp protease ATP-binding subunit ClpA